VLWWQSIDSSDRYLALGGVLRSCNSQVRLVAVRQECTDGVAGHLDAGRWRRQLIVGNEA